MTEPLKAVFLSYASQDAQAARRICEALRSSGIEVWFDQSELRGGDVWDHKIRQQIHDCTLFIPVISAHTDERTEGYFRLEWKLAVDRSHLMADDAAFLFPVVIDETPDTTARVPEKFCTVQWTRLPAGEAPPAFCQRVSALLAGTAKPGRVPTGAVSRATILHRRQTNRRLAIAAVAVLLIGAFGLPTWRLMTTKPGGTPTAPTAASTRAPVAPEHSIAVLPFADMSAGKDQEYFSDGLAEELLNLLSKVPGLQVAARTSAFSFKGQAADIPTIGRQLMVAHVLEGSVRKAGSHLRVTAQLVRADNGYEVWSGNYDRELGDVFHLQDEIAAAVVKALKVTLLGAAPHSTGTQNPDAHLVFLQGRAKMATQRLADIRQAAEDFEHVIKLDANYGPAYVELTTAKLQLAEFEGTGNRQAAFDSAIEQGKVLIEQALALDPTNAQAYVERGYLRAFSDLSGAEKDYRRGIELNPNSARGYERLASALYEDPRRRDEALAMLDRARRLDPLEPKYDVLKAIFLLIGRSNLREADALGANIVARHPLYAPGLDLLAAVRFGEGRYAEAVMYHEQALKLDPLSEESRRELIMDYSYINDLSAARQVADEAPHKLPIQRLLIYNQQGDWGRAAEVTYGALADGTMTPLNEANGIVALRMEARATGDFRRARAVLERLCGVTWSAGGIPGLPTQLGVATASVALGDLLIASGERERGERLLRASLADVNHVAYDLKRGDYWYLGDQAIAYSLLGDRKATIAALRKAMIYGFATVWWPLAIDPAFAPIRGDPEFQAIVRAMNAKTAIERQALERLRAAGRVPIRSGATKAESALRPVGKSPAETP